MLDGLQVAVVGGQIRLICPTHQTAVLWKGNLSVAGGPVQFVKHCSVDYCQNLAYSATEAALDQEVLQLGQQAHG
jgi:hypothetical protein